MEVERVASGDGQIGLWAFEWDPTQNPPQKVNRTFLGYEQPLRPTNAPLQQVREAICWSYGRTLGNIAVFTEAVLGSFPSNKGDDAILACDVVEAGKMRNGAKRWWCRTHQRHWGTKADIESARRNGAVQCSNHTQPMSYAIDPPHFRVEDYAEIGIWCSMPPALTSMGQPSARRPKIHVHVRVEPGGNKVVDQDVEALSLLYSPADDLFASSEITKVHVTPPAAFEFVLALETGLEMDCINCRDCGYPHLDLGEFGRTAHTKHLCGNCGRDNTWSRRPIASTPLKPLHDHFRRTNSYIDSTKSLNMDEYPGADFAVWASTPAVIWTGHSAQERGIHVYLGRDGVRIIDDTFGTVIYRGERLERSALFHAMVAHTIV